MLLQRPSSPTFATTAGRRAYHKRRKLEPPATNLPLASSAQPAPQPSPDLVSLKPLACSVCYRAFRGLFSHFVACSRCKQQVCSICSRTCSGRPSDCSPIPTSSHQDSPIRPISARRFPLNITQVNAHGDSSIVGKRRKPFEDDGPEDQPENSLSSDFKIDRVPGCMRAVCRSCCHEDPQSHTSLCYDCRDRLHPPQGDSQDDDIVRMIEV